MEGAAGMHTMDNFDCRATGTVGQVEMRLLSHSCSHCLKADFEKCDKNKAQSSDNSVRMLVVNEKNYSGASEGIAILKERMAEALLEVKVGHFVALWAGQNNRFQVAKVAKPIRKAKLGGVINGQPTNHGQYYVLEIEWGDQVRGGAAEADLYKFETMEGCVRCNGRSRLLMQTNKSFGCYLQVQNKNTHSHLQRHASWRFLFEIHVTRCPRWIVNVQMPTYMRPCV